jgi:hypothetical protein
MKYEPPSGMRDFVRVVQQASPEVAENLLRLAFDDAGATTLLADMRLRAAAPTLLATVIGALLAVEQHQQVDHAELLLALTVAIEGPESLTRG